MEINFQVFLISTLNGELLTPTAFTPGGSKFPQPFWSCSEKSKTLYRKSNPQCQARTLSLNWRQCSYKDEVACLFTCSCKYRSRCQEYLKYIKRPINRSLDFISHLSPFLSKPYILSYWKASLNKLQIYIYIKSEYVSVCLSVCMFKINSLTP
jgi:hypothetical protein